MLGIWLNKTQQELKLVVEEVEYQHMANPFHTMFLFLFRPSNLQLTIRGSEKLRIESKQVTKGTELLAFRLAGDEEEVIDFQMGREGMQWVQLRVG